MPTLECPHAALCAGCPLLDKSPREQAEDKLARQADALTLFPELGGLVRPTQVVSTEALLGHRRRVKLAVAGKAIGLFARGTHEVVDIPECPVMSPALRELTGALRLRLPAPLPLVALDLRATETGLLATAIVETSETSTTEATRLAVRQLFAGLPGLDLAVSRRPPGSPRMLGTTPEPLSAPRQLRDRLGPARPWFPVAHGAFVQAHFDQADKAHTAISARLEQLGRGLRILELFAGSGALALRLAGAGHQVTAVESFPSAVQALQSLASEQQLTLTTHAADADEFCRAQSPGSFDVILVDPPRRGLSPELRAELARLAPRLLGYLSCDPETLARDMSALQREGLHPVDLSAWDFIPLSDEVESLAWLEPTETALPRVLYSDEQLIAVEKPAQLSTTPQGEYSDSLLARVRRLPAAASAVPVHRLDRDTSGVCLFARLPEHVAWLAAALTAGNKRYLALVRGITRKKGNIKRPLREGNRLIAAETRYKRLEVVGTHSLLELSPQQGRKHQLRRHLADIGHPVLGDPRYGDSASLHYFRERHALDRVFLHCGSIELALKPALTLTSKLPPELELVCQRLRATKQLR